ncbi:PaaI family thioesterase [Thalassobius vesicularis]|uniref:PaaI family thioesterase n=1 Tax=Thalassobius vesicularis TaxID=1294297 RepID=A0A4S3MAJ3_9RHOB|nr:PaaI family thioesterase [Thalassobius vesicularis]THD73850.1 PaaI family thioesterase [Thalassobius vesicularis]
MDARLLEDPYALQRHLGFEITEWSQDFARVEQPLLPHLMNRYGIPHGGVYATLLDTAMGFCGCFTGDPETKRLAMTLSMNVNYEGRAQGTRLICEGRRTGGGAKTFFAEALVTDELGTRIASGTGVFRVRGT